MSPLKKRTPCRPALEPLEDRCVPAIIPVTSPADDGAGTLRAAITEANLRDDADTITFSGAAAAGSIGLQSALPALTHDVTIAGPGANLLSIERGGIASYRFFEVQFGVRATLSGLTLIGGRSPDRGGCVFNPGDLTICPGWLDDNFAEAAGGAVYSSGSLTIQGSTISNSRALVGGGVAN